MLTSRLCAVLMGLAVSASLFGCSHWEKPAISREQAAAAQAVGERLAREDRENTARHRAELAKLMTIDGITVEESDRSVTISFNVHNRTAKAVLRIEAGLESDRIDGSRVGMTEIHANAAVPANSVKRITVWFPYTQFGDDTGAMREAKGTPQRYTLDVKEIKYANGTDAGYDD